MPDDHIPSRYAPSSRRRWSWPGQRYTISIITDRLSALTNLREFLQRQLFQTQQTGDGWGGYFLAQASPPNVVLMDSHLSNMSGLMLCRLFKLNGFTRAVPVIIVANGDEWSPHEAFRAGAADYIRDDCPPAEILARIRVQLQVTRRLTPTAGMGCGEQPRSEEALWESAVQLLTQDRDISTVKLLAKRLGTNERKLSALCKAHKGITMHRYMVRLKLSTASRLLAETTMPIADIARHAGFQSPCNFSVAFRQYAGTSPIAYRSQRSSVHSGIPCPTVTGRPEGRSGLAEPVSCVVSNC